VTESGQKLVLQAADSFGFSAGGALRGKGFFQLMLGLSSKWTENRGKPKRYGEWGTYVGVNPTLVSPGR
jgi:hypothetical protein